jgi:RHS repeat-associated protein
MKKGLWRFIFFLTLLCVGVRVHAGTVIYIYTDPQGTPLAEAGADGGISATFDYRPYGKVVLGSTPSGPGYTGHVSDPDVDLVYMQQRYYDPVVSRFLSIDPIAPDRNTGRGFNRYTYAASNPSTFKDPDGRQECRSCEMSYGAAVGYMLRDDPQAMRIWSSGEAAAGTAGSGAEDGAALGQAIGQFIDDGDFSGPAVATVAVKAVVTVVTHGKYKPGGRFSPSTKRIANDRASGKCEYCGVKTVPGQKSQRGVKPPKNEGATDHIVPRSKGGTNSPDNAAHACRECNGNFSDNPKPPPPRDNPEH